MICTFGRGLAPALVLALALSGAGQALAATPINETRPLDPDGRVEIENLKGRIEVRAWDRSEVKIEGSLGEGVEKLEITGDRRGLAVRVKYPRGGSGRGFLSGTDRSEPTDLRLMVPLRADLEIDAVSADIDVSGVASGVLSIDSVSGDIIVAAAPRQAQVESVSGDLRLTLNSGQVGVESVSGDIIVAAAPRQAQVESVSGDLRLTLNSGQVGVESVSGDVQLRGRIDGEVKVESVSGDVVVETVGSNVRRFAGATVSGDMRIDTALASGGRISLESVSGDLDVRLPGNLSARVRAESFSGKLTAPEAAIQRPKHGPGSSFDHRYGAGDGEVSIESFSGDATLRLK